MDVMNGTRFALDATQAIDKTGAPWLLVLAKASYRIPDDPAERRPELAPQQRGLLASDLFEGEAGLSAPRVESDYVLRKPHCDVLVTGRAHAPGGEPSREFQVGIQVGPVRKLVRVLGPRRWVQRRGAAEPELTAPEPCLDAPLSYGHAFGGMYGHQAIGSDDPARHLAHPANLVGRGYARDAFMRLLPGTEAPCLEHPDDPIRSCTQLHIPASLGPVARNWAPRLQHAGTYDQHWQDEVFPLLPADFDERFNQCAPADQQMPWPVGGEDVALLNLTPGGGVRRFRLPRLALPLVVLPRTRDQVALQPVVDTLLVDTDTMSFDIVWRASLPLRRSLHEIDTVAAGSVCRRWWQARVFGTQDCGCGGKETRDEDLAPVSATLLEAGAPGWAPEDLAPGASPEAGPGPAHRPDLPA